MENLPTPIPDVSGDFGADQTVFLVDDDDNMRSALCRMLRRAGYRVEGYGSAERFLDAYRPPLPAVLVLDLKMPGIGGLALQYILAERNIQIPTVILTGTADVQTAVSVMKLGAVDLLEKPVEDATLLKAIDKAIQNGIERRKLDQQRASLEARLRQLTETERKVLDVLATGLSTKAIAYKLGVSIRTVDAHRSNIKRKTRARSLAEVMNLAVLIKSLGLDGEAGPGFSMRERSRARS